MYISAGEHPLRYLLLKQGLLLVPPYQSPLISPPPLGNRDYRQQLPLRLLGVLSRRFQPRMDQFDSLKIQTNTNKQEENEKCTQGKKRKIFNKINVD